MKSSPYFFYTKIIQNGGSSSHDMKPRLVWVYARGALYSLASWSESKNLL